jgi:hypothetical protein
MLVDCPIAGSATVLQPMRQALCALRRSKAPVRPAIRAIKIRIVGRVKDNLASPRAIAVPTYGPG